MPGTACVPSWDSPHGGGRVICPRVDCLGRWQGFHGPAGESRSTRLEKRTPLRESTQDTKGKRVIHEGTRSGTGLPDRHRPRPGNPASAPLRGKSDGRRTPRERGRPARILSLRLPLGFPAMRQPVTLPAGTAWARPKQSHGAVAGRPGSRKWPRLCQALCGRDARAPGGLHPMTSSHQRRSIGLRAHWCSFVVRLH